MSKKKNKIESITKRNSSSSIRLARNLRRKRGSTYSKRKTRLKTITFKNNRTKKRENHLRFQLYILTAHLQLQTKKTLRKSIQCALATTRIADCWLYA